MPGRARYVIAASLVSAIAFSATAQYAAAAVAYAAVGTGATGSTALSVPYPAGVAAGNLLVLSIVNKHPTAAPVVPSGWEAIASSTANGGIGTNGVDSGAVYATVFVRVADGTESGNVTINIPGGNCAAGAITRYTKGAGTYWSLAAIFGNDNIAGNTAWSVTAKANPGITSGDMIVTTSGINSDGFSYASQSMTATGATLGSHTERIEQAASDGNDCEVVVATHAVTAGTANAAPVFTMTSNTSAASSPTGGTVFLRIREVSNLSADDLTITDSVNVTGALSVLGTLAKGGGSFVIDHPLYPRDMLLYHSFVESPDVKNVYDGIATLDENGEALVELPSYFLSLNRDFRYLATPIGEPMPNLHLASGVRRWFLGLFGTPVFRLAGGAPHGTVSWQVTGVCKDPFILANPIVPEVEKGPDALIDTGQYICEECYGG